MLSAEANSNVIEVGMVTTKLECDTTEQSGNGGGLDSGNHSWTFSTGLARPIFILPPSPKSSPLEGVKPVVSSSRYYPYSGNLVHVVGYVGQASLKDIERMEAIKENLVPGLKVGKSGIEYSNEKDIRLNGLLYYNYFSDKILTEQIGDFGSSPTVFTYNNISNATYQGIELFADYVHSNSLTLKFNLNLRDEFDSEGKKLKNTIPYSTGFELSYLIRTINTRLYLNQSQSYRYATDTSFGLVDMIFNTYDFCRIANI